MRTEAEAGTRTLHRMSCISSASIGRNLGCACFVASRRCGLRRSAVEEVVQEVAWHPEGLGGTYRLRLLVPLPDELSSRQISPRIKRSTSAPCSIFSNHGGLAC
jgi:hypothetical protein